MSLMSMQSRERRIWRGLRPIRALAALGAVALVAALVGPAGAADRRPPVGPDAAKATGDVFASLYATATTTSSKGKKLVARLGASQSSLNFRLSLPSGAEDHQWSFNAGAGGWDVNGDGQGKLTMGTKATAGFAKLKVSVTPTGKFKSYTCGGKVYLEERPIKVTGVYFNDSKSDKWGHVGSKSKTNFVLKGTFSKAYDVDCGEELPDCVTSLSWRTSHSASGTYEVIGGYSSGQGVSAYGYRSYTITGSTGGWGYDYVLDSKTTRPKLKVKADGNATLDVWAGPGSAVLSSTGPKDADLSFCGTDDIRNQVVESWNATVAKGAKPLKVTMQAAPAVVGGNSWTASFSHSYVDD